MAMRPKRWQELSKTRYIDFFLNEGLGVIGGAGALFAFLALLSYNEADPTFFYTASHALPIANWCGSIGATCAAHLFYFFGMIAYGVVFAFFALCGAIMIRYPVRLLSIMIGVALTSLPFLCIIARVCHLDWHVHNPGGVLGYSMAYHMVPSCGLYGTLVICAAVLWVLAIIATGRSIQSAIQLMIKRIYVVLCQIIAQTRYHYNAWVQYICAQQLIIHTHVMQSYISIRGFIHKHQKTNVVATMARAQDETQAMSGACVDSMNIVGRSIYDTQQPIVDSSTWATTCLRFSTYERHRRSRHVLLFGIHNIMRLPNTVTARSLFDATHPVLRKLLGERERVATFDSEPSAPYSENVQSNKILLETRVSHTAPVEYRLPDLTMFASAQTPKRATAEYDLACKERAKRLEEKLYHFGVKGHVTAIRPGPVITLFEYQPDIDTKISKIIALEDDLALALKALSIRIIAPIPGRNVVGFEIANEHRESVLLADIFLREAFVNDISVLPLVLGSDIIGNPVIEDLVAMPHILVAGSTGSGKSVGLNAMLMSLLCKRTPEELRLILIDPKRLEFAPYHDIPHLLFPIVTNPRKASPILKWLVQEMEHRYEIMAQYGVRNLIDYRTSHTSLCAAGHDAPNLPFIILVVDELADLMMVAGKEVEQHIARLAQMARAAGIHIILATQRPSVDVITGVIKVNFPSRIGYRVSSKIDSKTILDTSGAEKLLGKGDMLYMNARMIDLRRVHGAYVSDEEIITLTHYIRSYGAPHYLDVNQELALSEKNTAVELEHDDLYTDVHAFVQTQQEISISMLQRKYRIGFNRSARLIEQLELDGLLAPAQGSKPRKVIR